MLIPRWLVACLIMVASGCASVSPLRFGPDQWHLGLQERGVAPEEAIYPFARSPEMDAWVERFMEERRDNGKLDRLGNLQQELFNPKVFPFIYEENLTLTAIEAFQLRRGNCMSFTALFITLSRAMGIDTMLVSVRGRPRINREGTLVMVSDHVVAGYVGPGALYLFDFAYSPSTRYTYSRVIDDIRASCLFHINLGAAAIRDGELEQARRHLELAVRIDPELPDAWLNLGVVRSRQGHTDGAIKAQVRALELDPTNSSAMANLSHIYEQLGQKELALSLLERAASQHDSTPFSLILLAEHEMTRGNLDKARRLLKRARRSANDEPAVYEALARLAKTKGKARRAASYLKKAAKLKPGSAGSN